jgi:hypothetical protein
MLYIPLTRAVADPDGYSFTFYLNVDQSLSITRSADNTHTRIRGMSVYTPAQATRTVDPTQQLTAGEVSSTIEVLVVETPEQIMALMQAQLNPTKSTRSSGTRKIGSPDTSPMKPA